MSVSVVGPNLIVLHLKLHTNMIVIFYLIVL